MLADPTFDGLDELRTTLADLKARRDTLATRLKPVDQPATPAITEDELRRWALAQFARLDDLATRTTVDLQDRQLVEAFVQRIEINPEAKTGEIILIADLADAFREGSTREPIGDRRGTRVERVGIRVGARESTEDVTPPSERLRRLARWLRGGE